jgi:tetratricopeptide (TPR) repeat protein
MTLFTARASGVRMVQAALALGLIVVSASSLLGQRRPEQLPRIMVPTFQSADGDLGQQTAEALRSRLSSGGTTRILYVIPRQDIENNLRQSGYPTNEALSPTDARQLATLLRADEYVDGVVTRTPTGVRVDARLVLARDYTVTQVLPSAEAPRLDNAINQVSRDLLEARRQVDAERACSAALRRNDVQAAIREAERGVQQNARYNNMIRVCLAQAYVRRDTGDDTTATARVTAPTLELVQQVLESDPRNITALRLAALGYRQAAVEAQTAGNEELASQNEDRYVGALTSLVAADPGDLRLQEQVVNELAASGRAAVAVPIIKDALANNPGDPRMMRTAWLVLLAAQDFPAAIEVGEEMVRVDTAAATADFFRRLGVAHLSRAQQLSRTAATAADSQAMAEARRQSLAAFQRGTSRFQNDAGLLTFYARALRDAGQPQQAADAARRALAIDASNNDAHVELVQAYVSARMWDQAAMAITSARGAGVDASLLSQVALSVGNNQYRAGQSSRERTDFDVAIRFLRLSNELETNLDAQFLLGASAFSLGDILTRRAQEGSDCASARAAQEAFALARTNLVAGQSQYPEPARQLLDAIGQFTTPLQQMVRAWCR